MASVPAGDQSADTPYNFAAAILAGIKAPLTNNNMEFLSSWIGAEGNLPNIDQNNFLDTTQPEAGSHGTNSAGVQTYPSFAVGVEATVQTLENGYYPGILSDLRGNVNAATNASQNASELNKWGTGAAGVQQNIARDYGGFELDPGAAVPAPNIGLLPGPPNDKGAGVTSANTTPSASGASSSGTGGLLTNIGVRLGLIIGGALVLLVGLNAAIKGRGAPISVQVTPSPSGGDEGPSGPAPEEVTEGSHADSSGTSPEFRKQFLGG
jgi:hypothetical protein